MDNSDGSFSMGEEPKGYAITGKIMLSAIVILFGIVIFMVLLHLYARWYITRVRRIDTTRRRNRVNRHTQIVFYVDNHLPGSAQVLNRGLEPEVLKSLPVFVYRSKKPDQDGPGPVSECAVCLSEFEEGETGRVLPKCNHSFHIECIDMWFHSHSTCPLCRSPVEPVQEVVCSQTGFDIGGPVQDEPCSSSCHCGDGEVSRRKSFDFSAVRIDIPRRTELENEISLSSSPHSHSFRSPGSRLSSIKRILSMNKKSPKGAATSSGLGTSCGDSVNGEFELESGLTQGQIHH